MPTSFLAWPNYGPHHKENLSTDAGALWKVSEIGATLLGVTIEIEQAAQIDGIEVQMPDGGSLFLNLTTPEHFLLDEFSESANYHEDLSYMDLRQIDRLEGFYGRWQRAKSVNARSAAMHRAVLEIDPRIAKVWAPMYGFRRGGCGRRRFRDTLQLIAMLRQRGLEHMIFSDMGLFSGLEGRASEGDGPIPWAIPRRCEGRSRAPGAAGGGSRRGGSRRGGGDRGDDSGGDGGSDSGGDGSAGSFREPSFWRYLKRVGIIVAIFGSLYTPMVSLVGSSDSHRMEKIIIKEKVVLRPFGSHQVHDRLEGRLAH